MVTPNLCRTVGLGRPDPLLEGVGKALLDSDDPALRCFVGFKMEVEVWEFTGVVPNF